MQLNQIYYGVVGAGHIGTYHAQQIQNIENVTLRGIYDLSLSLAQKTAKRYNTLSFESLGGLLGRCNVITIATPAKTHFNIARQ